MHYLKIAISCFLLAGICACFFGCGSAMQTTKTVMLPPIEFTYGNIPDRVCAKGRCENMEGAEGYVVCGKDKIRIYVKKFQVMPEGIFQLPKKCTPR